MREIKFRGKNDQGWHYGLLTFMFGSYAISHVEDENIIDLIDAKTICQYTGLKDKNNVEIYEKDYVRFGGIVALVTWSDKYCQFRLDDGTATISLNIHRKNDYEVVGNLCENPELLEVEK